MNDARAGMHNGPWHDTREKRTLSPARRSRFGVSTPASPAQPIMSARCWSDITSTMFGAPDMRQLSPCGASRDDVVTCRDLRRIPGARRVDLSPAELRLGINKIAPPTTYRVTGRPKMLRRTDRGPHGH